MQWWMNIQRDTETADPMPLKKKAKWRHVWSMIRNE
jgi:hypothetical protein